MTAIGDLCTTVRGWLALGPDVYPDPVVTSWVRMTEEWMSENLRVKHMVQIDWSEMTDSMALLPADWQELDTVKLRGGKPLIYRPRDEFDDYDPTATPNYNKGRFTIIGNYLIVGNIDVASGTEVQISYYQSIPPLDVDPNWVIKYYSRVYVIATCWHAAMYSIEDNRKDMWQDQVYTFTNDMNKAHMLSKASGSILVANVRKRSFG